MLPHLNARDVTFAVISRAPLAEIQAFQKRMGWKFEWFSSNGTDFNFDYKVSFKPEERVDGKIAYNYTMMDFPSEEGPGPVCFARMWLGMFSILIQPMREVWTFFSVRITSWTLRQKDATRKGWRIRCPG
jgi:predicted dithiol-disulfide oxidoreductase (DUF899 family)